MHLQARSWREIMIPGILGSGARLRWPPARGAYAHHATTPGRLPLPRSVAAPADTNTKHTRAQHWSILPHWEGVVISPWYARSISPAIRVARPGSPKHQLCGGRCGSNLEALPLDPRRAGTGLSPVAINPRPVATRGGASHRQLEVVHSVEGTRSENGGRSRLTVRAAGVERGPVRVAAKVERQQQRIGCAVPRTDPWLGASRSCSSQ